MVQRQFEGCSMRTMQVCTKPTTDAYCRECREQNWDVRGVRGRPGERSALGCGDGSSGEGDVREECASRSVCLPSVTLDLSDSLNTNVRR